MLTNPNQEILNNQNNKRKIFDHNDNPNQLTINNRNLPQQQLNSLIINDNVPDAISHISQSQSHQAYPQEQHHSRIFQQSDQSQQLPPIQFQLPTKLGLVSNILPPPQNDMDLTHHLQPPNLNESKISQLHDFQSIPPQNLQNILTLFKSQNPLIQSSNQNQSQRMNQSSFNSQYYATLEGEGERIREKLKADAKVVHYIIDKHKKTKADRVLIIGQLEAVQAKLMQENDCTKYKRFSKEIKYQFNQLESKTNELKDLFNESYELMTVFSMSTHEKLSTSFLAEGEVTETDFTSFTLKLFSDLELQAKNIESNLSEQKRLLSISPSNQEFKQVCQALVDMIQKFPTIGQNIQQQITNVQKSASQYFKQLSAELQKQLSHYTSVTDSIRHSYTSIDKMKYIISQCKDEGQLDKGFYSLIDLLNNQQQSSADLTIDQNINKGIAHQLVRIQLEDSRYFQPMRNKMYNKCCLEITMHKAQQNTYHNILTECKEYVIYYQKYQQANYFVIIQNLIYQLEQKLQKQPWLQMMQLHKELSQHQLKFKQFKNYFETINLHNQGYVEFKGQFLFTLEEQCTTVQQVYPYIKKFIDIKDIDAQIEFHQVEADFKVQQDILNPFIDQILPTLQQTLFDFDNLSSNSKGIKQKFQGIKKLNQQFDRIAHKKIIGNVIQIKQDLQEYLKVESGVTILMDQMPYLNPTNFLSIQEDYYDTNFKFQCVDQLDELVKQSVKEISTINSDKLIQITQQYLIGFQWVSNVLTMLKGYQKQLILLVQRNVREMQLDQSQGGQFNQQIVQIPYSEFEQFISTNKFSHLYFHLNQCPKLVNWTQILKQLSKIFQNTFAMYMSKILPQINILGGDILFSVGQFDVGRSTMIINWFNYDRTSTDLEKVIIAHQIFNKLKPLKQSVNLDPTFKYNIDEIHSRLLEIIIKYQQAPIKLPEIEYIITQVTGESSFLYIQLQNQWVIDYLTANKSQFMPELMNHQGVFDLELLRDQGIVLDRVRAIYQEQPGELHNISKLIEE